MPRRAVGRTGQRNASHLERRPTRRHYTAREQVCVVSVPASGRTQIYRGRFGRCARRRRGVAISNGIGGVRSCLGGSVCALRRSAGSLNLSRRRWRAGSVGYARLGALRALVLGVSGGMVSVTGLGVPNYVQSGVLSDVGHGWSHYSGRVFYRFILMLVFN